MSTKKTTGNQQNPFLAPYDNSRALALTMGAKPEPKEVEDVGQSEQVEGAAGTGDPAA